MKSNSKYKSIAIFLISCLLGISSYPFSSSARSEESKPIEEKGTSDSIVINNDPYTEKNILKTDNDLSGQYSILNPNLLNINGPDVSLVFKDTEANNIFEYLAEIGNYGFVWVKNNPTNDSSGNERLITLTLKNVSYQTNYTYFLVPIIKIIFFYAFFNV